jgi:hypothetical protein
MFTEKEKSPLLGVNGEHPYLASAEEGAGCLRKHCG